MIEYRPSEHPVAWPHCVNIDDEIIRAVPTPYIRYDIYIKDRKSCELFIELNGERWRTCAELILKKFEDKQRERMQVLYK